LAESRRPGVAPKLERLYEGPYLVVGKTGEINFTIQTSAAKGATKLVHHNKLKPYEGPNMPKWITQRKLSSSHLV